MSSNIIPHNLNAKFALLSCYSRANVEHSLNSTEKTDLDARVAEDETTSTPLKMLSGTLSVILRVVGGLYDLFADDS